MVAPEHQGRGLGRALLERCWPGDPTPDLGRVVVATGAPADLTLYPDFGVMPVTGHWHMRVRTEALPRAPRAGDGRARPGRARAVARPRGGRVAAARAARDRPRAPRPARVLRARPHLPGDHVARRRRDRALLGLVARGDRPGRRRRARGPRAGRAAALDRVAKTQEPDELSLFCTTTAWWLLRRLRGLGFRVYWPSWVMCSVPLPGPRQLPAYAPAHTTLRTWSNPLKDLGMKGAGAGRPAASPRSCCSRSCSASCRRSPGLILGRGRAGRGDLGAARLL